MKKILAIVFVLALCLSLAACSQVKEKVEEKLPDTVESVVDRIEDIAETPEKVFGSLEEFVDNAIEQAGDSLNNETLAIRIYPDGDTLVYEYTYKEQIPEDQLPAVKEKLEESFETNAEIYTKVLEEIKKTVDIIAPSVKLIYKNHDGTVIAEYEYK